MFSDTFAAAREALGDGAKFDTKDECLRGRVGEIDVAIRYTLRGAGSSSEKWTEVEVAVPLRDLVLSIRPQTSTEDGFIREGLAIDLQTRDAPFDAAFVVEAAPSDIALTILDEEVRKDLLSLHPIALVTFAQGVRLEESGWVENVERMRAMAALVANVSRRIPSVWEEAAREIEGYRNPKDSLEAKRDEEIAAVRKVQSDREAEIQRRGCMLAILIVVVIIVFNVIVILAKS